MNIIFDVDYRNLPSSEAKVTVFKKFRNNTFKVLITAPLFIDNNTGIQRFLLIFPCSPAYSVLSVLCFPNHVHLYYSCTQKECSSVVSVVSPELTPDTNIWVIDSEVLLGKDYNYSICLMSSSHNGAGITKTTGAFSIS